MENRISVCLTGPAKIAGKWRKPGEDVDVTPDQVRDLAAAGVIPQGMDLVVAEMAPGMPGFDEAVTVALDAATADLVADLEAARARLADADAEVDRQHSRIMQLEAELATAGEANAVLSAEIEALKAPNTDAGGEAAPAAEPATAPKSTRKKGAGVADQG